MGENNAAVIVGERNRTKINKKIYIDNREWTEMNTGEKKNDNKESKDEQELLQNSISRLFEWQFKCIIIIILEYE